MVAEPSTQYCCSFDLSRRYIILWLPQLPLFLKYSSTSIVINASLFIVQVAAFDLAAEYARFLLCI